MHTVLLYYESILSIRFWEESPEGSLDRVGLFMAHSDSPGHGPSRMPVERLHLGLILFAWKQAAQSQ